MRIRSTLVKSSVIFVLGGFVWAAVNSAQIIKLFSPSPTSNERTQVKSGMAFDASISLRSTIGNTCVTLFGEYLVTANRTALAVHWAEPHWTQAQSGSR
jgi:hypothetical protein